MKTIKLEKMLGVPGILISEVSISCETVELEVNSWLYASPPIKPKTVKFAGRQYIKPVEMILDGNYTPGDKIPIVETDKFFFYDVLVSQTEYSRDGVIYTLHISYLKVKQ